MLTGQNMRLLQRGDTIRIIAPARKITMEELNYSIRLLEEQGYCVEFGENLFGQYHQFSGTDKERIADFQEALDDEKVKVIWFARGGYGSVRMIDCLDFTRFIQHPKWICGYSDVTVFHAYVNTVLNIPSLHATMPLNVQGAEMEINSFNTMLTALQTGKASYSIPFHPLNRVGEASGKLCGGNLSVLYSINGSVTDLQTAGKILFIEDVDEYFYHIDRMMMCLKRAGKLNNLAALIVGGMSDMHDNAVPFGKRAEEIIMEHVAEYDYAVCFGFPAGHIPDNRALIMGKDAQLEVSDEGVILQG
jgi:muramoyltetrapeptide carboxypeptidase